VDGARDIFCAPVVMKEEKRVARGVVFKKLMVHNFKKFISVVSHINTYCSVPPSVTQSRKI
jgi:hypothetical protein